MARGGARPGAGRPVGKSANTSPPARDGSENQRPWPADKVERWSIDRLIPYAKNARTHTDAQVAAIAASIKEWGWTTPVLRCFAAQATISTSLIAVMPEAGYDPQGPSARGSLRPRPPALCRPSVAMNSFSSRARRRTTPAPASTLASSSRCIPPGPAPRSASRLNS
jgi:hypothetical protein